MLELDFRAVNVVFFPRRESKQIILDVYIYINLTALKSNSNTVWFNFQTYILTLFGLILRRIY